MPSYKHHVKDVPAKLHVVASIFNPRRYQSRYRLNEEFQEYMGSNPAVELWTGEVALGNRPHVVTDSENPKHFRFYSKTELWSKEAVINAVIRRIPRDSSQTEQYICWSDADVRCSRHDWAEETIHQLQHYKVVQPWSSMQDLGPNHQVIGKAQSAGYAYVHSLPMRLAGGPRPEPYGELWHPGFMWAARRSALDTMGGLIDFDILGAADAHMCAGIIGKMSDVLHPTMSDNYKVKLMNWQKNALKLDKDFGYVDNHLLHHFHGAKRNRFYESRWNILTRNQYCPDTDIVYNSEGIPELSGEKLKLRDQIRCYMQSRNEDSIDL